MKKNRIFITTILILTITFSCKDVLDTEPFQSLSTEESLSDFNSLQTALFGTYDGLQSRFYYGRDYIVNPEVGGENVYITIDNSNRFLVPFRYEMNSFQTQENFWQQAYDIILRANNIINNIDLAVDATEEEKNQVLGEALALRALAHFDLSRTFSAPYAEGGDGQGIPIMLEAAIGEPARNTLSEVYAQVETDLAAAKTLITVDNGANRLSVNAVNALLARVALYKGDNATAEARATDVISAGDYTLFDGTDLSTFYSTSRTSEEIFTLNFNVDESLGANNLGGIYNPSGYGDIRVTTDIIDSYELGDTRRDLIYMHAGEYYNGKFLGESGIPGLASPKILRFAEVILIRAEARAKQDNFSGATADVNLIRNRAQLADFTGNVTLEEVLAEKNREFAFEGHRTFDLWRNGKPLIRVQANTGLEVEAPSFIAADSYLRIFPLPESELNTNSNITQALGY